MSTQLPKGMTTTLPDTAEGGMPSDGPPIQCTPIIPTSSSHAQPHMMITSSAVQPIELGGCDSAASRQPTRGITLSTKGLAFAGGGFTLTNNQTQKPGLKGTSTSGKILQPSVTALPLRKVVTITSSTPRLIPLSNNSNAIPLSTSKACVYAQQQLAMERRTNSAPGLMGLKTTSESAGGVKTKYKYQKVFGGKLEVEPRRMSMVRNFWRQGLVRAVLVLYDTKNMCSNQHWFAFLQPTDNLLSPQIFLDHMLQSRGYSCRTFCSLEGGYHCAPTALQKASYGIKLIEAIRHSNDVLVQKMLQAGISSNPCNAFGESVIHMVCRRGDYKLLKVFKDHGCSLQVTDDFGRTPLHDACWTADPHFDIVEMILDVDVRLIHLVDCRLSPPLSYVKRAHWGEWITFLQSKADKYWPPRDVHKDGEEPPPVLCQEASQSRPIKDPPNAMPIEAAQRVSSGQISPDQYIASLQESVN
jgi:Ankyrin repeats (3 copies)